MYFELLPGIVRRSVEVHGGEVIRTIDFSAAIDTRLSSWDYEPSILNDGRVMGSLSCGTSIRPTKSCDRAGSLTFIPAAQDPDLHVHEPDCLALELLLPAIAFDELWQAISSGQYIILGGRVDDLPHQHPYLPTPSPYIWDVESPDNRTKPVREIWFALIQKTAGETATEALLELLRARGEDLPQHYAEMARMMVKKKFDPASQIYWISLRTVEQAAYEAMQAGIVGPSLETLISETLALVNSAYGAIRNNSGQEANSRRELWTHKDVLRQFGQGRETLDQWTVDPHELAGVIRGLIERPWLRLDVLELAIVDALTFWEVFQFWKTLAGTLGSRPRMWAHPKMMDSVFLGRSEKRRAAYQRLELLQTMVDAYDTMQPTAVLSPYQIRSALLSAQGKGAVWKASSFGLLDRAAMRDPPVWIYRIP